MVNKSEYPLVDHHDCRFRRVSEAAQPAAAFLVCNYAVVEYSHLRNAFVNARLDEPIMQSYMPAILLLNRTSACRLSQSVDHADARRYRCVYVIMRNPNTNTRSDSTPAAVSVAHTTWA